MDDSKSVEVPVQSTQIMVFARAIGDQNRAFVDLSHQDRLVAPPTFTETLQHFIPDYEYRPHPGRPWLGSGATATGTATPPRTGQVTLHAEQHFEYHAPVRAGDTLRATTRPGKTWQKAGRSGTMHFFERITDFVNQQGDLAVTSTLVGVTIEPNSKSEPSDV